MQVDSVTEYHRKRAEELFGFCISDFRAECFWFEPVDMLRKLALSGLLQFVHRGTAAQCFCGSVIAFASFGVQQWLRPYLEHESNILKAVVDTQLFLTFLISFLLRVLPEINSGEPVGALFYGWLQVCSMGVLVIAAIGLTVMQVWRRQSFMRRLLGDTNELGTLTRSASEQSLGASGGFSVGLSGVVGTEAAPSGDATGTAARDDDDGEEPPFGSGGGGAFTVGQPQPAAAAAGLSRPVSPSRTAAVGPSLRNHPDQ